ncbi:transposase [Streptomyces sp. NPDC052687]|uniref:transposase n=1 Tax=Streptomyces sp. NPDC052687 TaxID=3154759 RepID=UPI003424916B
MPLSPTPSPVSPRPYRSGPWAGVITVHRAGKSHGRAVGGVGPLLPKGAKAGRRPVCSRRLLIDGIRFGVRTGVPWRDMPVEYGLWGRIYDLGEERVVTIRRGPGNPW